MKVDLKLKNLPFFVEAVTWDVLMKDSILREFGQLVNVKLVRIVAVHEPT